jgi:hypothetical protein
MAGELDPAMVWPVDSGSAGWAQMDQLSEQYVDWKVLTSNFEVLSLERMALSYSHSPTPERGGVYRLLRYIYIHINICIYVIIIRWLVTPTERRLPDAGGNKVQLVFRFTSWRYD